MKALPGLVATARDRWELALGPLYPDCQVAYVAPAVRRDGERVVLKVSFVGEETRHEPDALQVWGGQGAVRLLDVDRALGAMLLERLEPGTPLSEHPDPERAIHLGCRLLRRLWRPVPDPHPFPLAVDLAGRLADTLPEEFERAGRPFDSGLVEDATATCRDLAAWTGVPVLTNRDFHFGNVLAARREAWLAIDPKPLVGEPAFDTGHLLRDLLHRDGLGAENVPRLVDRLGSELSLDRERIRAWAFVRSVDDALWSLRMSWSAAWDLRCAELVRPGGPGL